MILLFGQQCFVVIFFIVVLLKCLLQLQQSKNREANLEVNIAKFLNSDQIDKLKRPAENKGSNIVWSSDTIQRCLAIRSIVGRNGYEYLRKLKFPLPSYRTLCRRIQNAPFAPGIQHDVLQWLKLKMDSKTEYEKLCVLLMDEMQLRTRVEFDKGLQKIVGYVSPETLPADTGVDKEKEIASHALVFMLRGLTSSWKQTVAYLFTGNSFKREQYWDFTKRVIEASEAAGFKIQCVTSDMGPVNTALWNHVGIQSMRNTLTPAITHPCDADRTLYFVADPPHLLKNLWNCVLAHRITINAETVKKHGLPSDVVTGTHVQQLKDLQQGHELRLAYKLKQCHVSPTQYEKMRVCLAAQFFSRTTAAAIQTCVQLELLPREALTTALFLNFVNDWFDAMNARHKDVALFRVKRTARTEALEEMLNVIKDLAFNGRKIWKPIQTGIQLSTTVLLQLSNEVMAKYKLQYFLTGRLSQDPVENLFSQARGQGVMHPSCSLFRHALRLVTIAQYLKVSKGAAYEEDDCSYLVDYLKDSGKADGVTVDDHCILSALLSASVELEAAESLPSDETVSTDPTGEDELEHFEPTDVTEVTVSTTDVALPSSSVPLRSVDTVDHTLGGLEGNALYDVIGWAISRFFVKVNCATCRRAFVSNDVSDDWLGKFTAARGHGGLTHPSKDILSAAKIAEAIFSSNKPSLHIMNDVEQDITKQVLDVLDAYGFDFPDCHSALQTIMKKFIRLRINEFASTVNSTNTSIKKQFGSKTACRITAIL